MTNIKKIGSKQWAMMVLSLSLALSSMLVPLEERQQSGSLMAASDAASEQLALADADRS